MHRFGRAEDEFGNRFNWFGGQYQDSIFFFLEGSFTCLGVHSPTVAATTRYQGLLPNIFFFSPPGGSETPP